jgi:hypothetical protein
MRKSTNNYLTPYQKVEQDIREAGQDEHPIGLPKRASDVPKQARDVSKRTSEVVEQRLERSNRPQKAVADLDSGATYDDLAPETLIREDGARSPSEAGDEIPADRTYRVVSREEAGGTYGPDEAELARIDPLDGEPWSPEDERPNHQR